MVMVPSITDYGLGISRLVDLFNNLQHKIQSEAIKVHLNFHRDEKLYIYIPGTTVYIVSPLTL